MTYITIPAGSTGNVYSECGHQGGSGSYSWEILLNDMAVASNTSNPNGWSFMLGSFTQGDCPGGFLNGYVNITVPSNAASSTPGSGAYGFGYASGSFSINPVQTRFDVSASIPSPPPPGPAPGPC